MKKSYYSLSAVSFLIVSTFARGELLPLGKVDCTVVQVDKTPINFIGPVGQMPRVGSTISLDLTAKEIKEDLDFDQAGGLIPVKKVKSVLVKNENIARDNEDLIPYNYFDGKFIGKSKAEYTLALSTVTTEEGKGIGRIQIARRLFHSHLELYNVLLNCSEAR